MFKITASEVQEMDVLVTRSGNTIVISSETMESPSGARITRLATREGLNAQIESVVIPAHSTVHVLR